MADRGRHARRASRGLSQNFLRSRRLADDIVRGLDVRPHELIVEIGAGDGRLTEPLARQARRVIAIELDPTLATALRARFVQSEVAQKRAAVVPSTQLGAEWEPWWEFAIVRRFDRSAFEPRPGVDAALLRVVRRSVASPLTLKRAAAAAAFDRAARPRDLDAHQWVALFLSAAHDVVAATHE